MKSDIDLQAPDWESYKSQLDIDFSVPSSGDTLVPFSQWAQKNFRLPEDASINTGGLINFDDAPYQRKIFEAVDDEQVKEIVLVCANQMTKTLFLTALVARCLMSRIPVMMASPDKNMSETLRERFFKVVAANPGLQKVVYGTNPRTGLSKNNDRVLNTGEGSSSIYWSSLTQKTSITSVAAQYVLLDEVPKMKRTYTDGGPVISFIQKRQGSFTRTRRCLTVACGSPTTKDEELWQRYTTTCQYHYECPCPACGTFQEYKWEQVRYEKIGAVSTRDEYIQCAHCDHKIDDDDRFRSISQGRWVAEVPTEIHRVGFNIGKLSSTFSTLTEICEDYETQIQEDNKTGFYGGTLGIPFEETIPEDQRVTPGLIRSNCLVEIPEEKNSLPDEVDYLTCGVDVQQHKLVAVVGGYNLATKDFYFIDHQEFGGLTASDPYDARSVWQKLYQLLATTYGTGNHRRQVKVCFIDRGFLPQNVVEFAHGHQSRSRIDALDGRLFISALRAPGDFFIQETGEYYQVSEVLKKHKSLNGTMRLIHSSRCNPHGATYELYTRIRRSEGDSGRFFMNQAKASDQALEEICSQYLLENPRRILGYEYAPINDKTDDHVLDATKYAMMAAQWVSPAVRLELTNVPQVEPVEELEEIRQEIKQSTSVMRFNDPTPQPESQDEVDVVFM